MTLDEIKAFCIDHSESSLASTQYTTMMKRQESFHVIFLGKDGVEYIQYFDKNGVPVGDICSIEYDEITIDLDNALWEY